jgi:hypothetical protein
VCHDAAYRFYPDFGVRQCIPKDGKSTKEFQLPETNNHKNTPLNPWILRINRLAQADGGYSGLGKPKELLPSNLNFT